MSLSGSKLGSGFWGWALKSCVAVQNDFWWLSIKIDRIFCCGKAACMQHSSFKSSSTFKESV